eukprot:11230939-Karenia_brevis.AAC.1
MRAAHKSDNKIKAFVSADAVCPVCNRQFSTRLRCIAHLTDKRQRRARTPCSQLLTGSATKRLPPDELARLD